MNMKDDKPYPHLLEGMTYYRRKGNKLYFKGVLSKVTVELAHLPPELRKMKYGDVVKLKYE